MLDTINLFQENLQERLNHITLITNGSQNRTLYKNMETISKFTNCHLAISIHTDHVDMYHIIELIENLSKNINIHILLMFNPDKRTMVHMIYEILLEERKFFPFSMGVSLLREGARLDPRYTAEDLQWHRGTAKNFQAVVDSVPNIKYTPPVKNRHDFHIFYDIENNGQREISEETDHGLKITNGMLKFTGMYCIAHSALLRIEDGGGCKGALCRAVPITGNIFEENCLLKNREMLIHAVQCPYPMCGCSANDVIPKFASPEEAKKFVEITRERQAKLFSSTKI